MNNWRSLLVFLYDLMAVAVAWALAFVARFNFNFNEMPWGWLSASLPVVLPVFGTSFLLLRLYRGLWRYASLADLRRILMAVVLATAASPLAYFMLRIEAPLPRSVLIIAPVLLLFIMCGSRMAYRMWKESVISLATHAKGEPVILVGAGDAAANLVKELTRSPLWRPVALLDDDPTKSGAVIHGVKVAGRIEDFPRVAATTGTRKAVLIIPSASREVRRRIADFCIAQGAELMTVPSVNELMRGAGEVELLRRVKVEDLLGRDPVQLESEALHEFLSRRIVMVTGAGGSIGSELCRQILRFEPSALVAFDVSEYALYQLKESFDAQGVKVPVLPVVGDVKNRIRVEQVLAQFKPAVVFHAAAYKHVPMMEELNAWEAVRNNALGTWTVAEAARRAGVSKFVLVSTDKAVNPTNVMGATKRMAEMLCQHLAAEGDTKYEIVRFGNVLGSAGSVIPKFQEQIAKGGPITVTHPEIIRYFMSIPEAAQLVLQAGGMGRGGEIFVLDMGEPVKIVDLARAMIRLSGLAEDAIEIQFTGLRPGEKLFEELLADDESTVPTHHPKLRIARAREVSPAMVGELLDWLQGRRTLTDDEVRRDLRRWVPEYAPAQGPRLNAVSGGRDAA
ncbi:polysaccharide biosynthesis protein [Uliginosibacterium sp. H1]|uniref:polysaccharide biosynthesis protein n=1 Tax=Uliginosibacterium sp. H1 TaxID=3114757 RepID=UPI002E197558|nr:nucleoside-diphosphate sugar epimerase/dehydratase [Uliginosibacterium sp. H1]